MFVTGTLSKNISVLRSDKENSNLISHTILLYIFVFQNMYISLAVTV